MLRFTHLPWLAGSSAIFLALASCGAMARTIEVGPGPEKEFKLPSAGIAAAHDGDTVKIAAGEYFDCAFVRTNNIVIEGVKFINNEDGILGGPDGSTMTIRNSEFTGNGGCDNPGGCAHGIYSGRLALLRIENTKFFGTKRAHHIKSRSLRTEVIGCDISDGPKGTASYEIEIANGGDLLVRNSTILKGAQAENHSGAIMIGTEGVTNPTRELTIENNSFRAEGDYNTFFVVNLTATPAMLKGNKISGNAKPLRGDGEVH